MTTTVATTEPAGEPNRPTVADLQPGQWFTWPETGRNGEVLSVHMGKLWALVVYRLDGVGEAVAARMLVSEPVRVLTADEVKVAAQFADRKSIAEQLRQFTNILDDRDLPCGGRTAYDVLTVTIRATDADEVDRLGQWLNITPTTDSARRYEVRWMGVHESEYPRLEVEWYVYLPKTAAEAEALAAEAERALAAVTVETDTTGFFFDQPDRLTDVESTPIAADVQAVALVGRPNGKAKNRHP